MLIDFDLEQCHFKRLIAIIQDFPLSVNFLQWLSDGDLEIHTTYVKKQNRRFERLAEISIQGMVVYSGGGEFFLDQLSKDFSDVVAMNEKEYYRLIPELATLNKKMISSNLVDSTYTIVSEFTSSNQLCGVAWEIFYMERVLKIYEERKKGFNISHTIDQKKRPTDFFNHQKLKS